MKHQSAQEVTDARISPQAGGGSERKRRTRMDHAKEQGQRTEATLRAGLATPAVTTYKGNALRTGQYPNETFLTPNNVNVTQFGKRVAYPIDGFVYAQPLFLPNVPIAGTTHNIVFVATQHDSVYAFDADQRHPNAPLWHTSFLDPAHGITTVLSGDISCNDIVPEVGITGTPVIDGSTGTLYVVAKTKEHGQVVQRLHALDITTGKERPGSPVLVQASVAGTGAGSSNGVVKFNPLRQHQRSALLLLNGVVYICWASHCDHGPYHGWIIGYHATTLQQVPGAVYNTSPNGTQAGIWQSGGGLAADSTGFIYFASGNGTFDVNTGGQDVGDSIVKLTTHNGLHRVDFFTPFNQECLNGADADLGSGGVLLLPTSTELICIGKEGRVYVVNRNHMGKYTPIANPCTNQNLTNVDKILQELPPGTIVGGVWGTPAYWSASSGEFVYTIGVKDHVKAFKLSNGRLSPPALSQSPESFTYPGGNPVVSSNGSVATTGIVWTIDPKAVLRAYNATDLSKELYNSGQNAGRDGLGSYVKFSVPTVANGKVFVGTQNSLVVYGLLDAVFNNVGTSDDSQPKAANFDGGGFSYSAQALQAVGIAPGMQVVFNNATFTWPKKPAGSANNYQAQGQTLLITPTSSATILAFLGSATNGPSTGTATITYTDGTLQTSSLGFSDWTLNGGTSTPSFGNAIVATATYRNGPTGKQSDQPRVFYAEVALQPGKTLQSVALPSSLNQGHLHVFAVGTR